MDARLASLAVLLVFGTSWLLAAVWAGKPTAAAPLGPLAPLYAGGTLYFSLLAVATVLVPEFFWRLRLWPPMPVVDWILVAVCVAAAAWCWWARLHIGKLWAGGVLVREGHRVVDTGPYAVVRHPIYTGGFALVLAFVAIRARPVGLLAALGMIVFFSLKARMEERFLREQLGPDYDRYRSRVPMLVPGMRR